MNASMEGIHASFTGEIFVFTHGKLTYPSAIRWLFNFYFNCECVFRQPFIIYVMFAIAMQHCTGLPSNLRGLLALYVKPNEFV